jgi:hypothetical protein
VPVSNSSLPLPTGASTETTLAALNAKHAGDTANGSVVQARADAVTTGNITASGQSVTAAVATGMAGFSLAYQGTYGAGITWLPEVSFDGGTTYYPLRVFLGAATTGTGYVTSVVPTASSAAFYVGDVPPGATHMRLRCSAWASPSGTLNVYLSQSFSRLATAPAGMSVTVSTLVPGSGATNLGKAEDAAHVSGDTGVAALGVRNDALAVLSSADGDYSVLATDGRGAVLTNSATFTYSHIATATTTTVKSGAGYLRGVVIGTKGTVASTVTVYDNTAGSGTVIAVLDTLNLSGTFTFEVAFSTGLTLVTTGTVAPDVTVSYR